MLVGEAPGENEERDGRPFVGAAGQLLDDILRQTGLKRDDLYITNAVKCRPPQNDTPGDASIAACMQYFNEEVATVKPKLIMALGNTALSLVTGMPQSKVRITKTRGKPLPQHRIDTDATVMATLHPASALYQDRRGNRDLIETDFRQAAAILNGEFKGDEAITALPESDEAYDALVALERSAVLSCDLEWTAEKGSTEEEVVMIWPWSKRGEAYTLGLAGRVDGRMLSVSCAFPMTGRTREQVQKLLASKKIIFHNSTVDLLWLAGTRFKGVELAGDTMYLAYLVDETQPLSLAACSLKYAQIANWKGVLAYERPGTVEEWRRLLGYNAQDVFATYRLYEELRQTILRMSQERREAILRLHNHLLIPATRVLVVAAYAGIPVDEAEIRKGMAETIERRDAVAEELAAVAHTTPVGAVKLAASPKQTLEFVNGTLGLSLADTREATLADFVGIYPEIEHILSLRGENKLLSTYFTPWLELLRRQGDGRLHTIYKPTGTRTGRMSSEAEMGAPTHQVPRAEWVRRMVRAKLGRKIVAGDYAQIELKCIAWKANEPTMLAMYRNDPLADLHRTTGAFNVAMRETGGTITLTDFWPDRERWEALVKKPDRDAAKGSNFGLCYGMREEKLRSYTKMKFGVSLTTDQARAMMDGYFRLYSRILPWHDEMMREASIGYVETEWGRRISIPQQDLHVAINTPIQSIASDLTVRAMNVLFERLRGYRAIIIGSIHDSIMVDVHEDDAEEVAAVMKQTMEDVNFLTDPFGFRIPVPITADVKVGDSWAA